MKKYISIILLLTITLSLVGCNHEPAENTVPQVSDASPMSSIEEPKTISFHDKTFNRSDLSQETIEWLEKYNNLSPEEQLAISAIPADLYKLCGYPKSESAEANAAP